MSTTRYGHMVHEYYVQRIRERMAERRTILGSLSGPGAAQAYVRRARRAAREAFGPEPERTPLNAAVTGRNDYGAFSIETVTYESRPGLIVSGNLYLPKAPTTKDSAGSAGPADAAGPAAPKAPAVLGLCGHSNVGKAEPKYQAFCQGLATKGFVVFIIDPISQGERVQFTEADGGPLPALCEGHNIMGNQHVLLGEYFGAWRAWDAIRGLDYLLSRPEVDTERVGVTGNSGGGTLTSFVTALDPRITMAAPSCYICSYLANIENEIPSDAEQNPPGILSIPFDQADLLLAFAPRPTIVLSQTDDFFDERYARAAFDDVRRIHELLGAEDSAAYYAGPHGHGYHQENREAMYAFFMKHAGVDGDAAEPPLVEIPEKDLNATPEGSTAAAGSKRIFDFIREAGEQLASARQHLGGADLVDACRRVLSVPQGENPPHYRNLTHYRGSETDLPRRSQYAVETEPGIQAIVTTYGAPHPTMHPPTGHITVFVGHTGAERDIAEDPRIRSIVEAPADDGGSLVGVDPRGFGVAAADTCNSSEFFDPYGSDYLYASTGEMLGESYLGRRVYDVERVLDFLVSKSAVEVDLVGRGLGSVIVAFAGLLHPQTAHVKLIDYLPSFADLTRDPLARWPLSSLPRGVLSFFDLPDVYAALGDRLELTSAWNARMQEGSS